MLDCLKSLSLGGEIIGTRGKKALNRYGYINFSRTGIERKKIDSITKHFQNEINNIFKDMDNISEKINDIFELYLRFLKKVDLTNEEVQNLIFEQIMIFINFLYRKLNSKYFFNTLSKNDLSSYNEMTIGDKLDSIIYRKGDAEKIYNTGCSCKHYALLFKDFFDRIEEAGLKISNYLYVEKTDGFNHTGLVVTFNGKNYLVDSSNFNKKLMQSFDELGEKYFDRMQPLANVYKEDISDDILSTIQEYTEHNDNYYKVALKSKEELLILLKSAPQDPGSMVNVHNILGSKNILDIIFSINFKITKDGILAFNKIFYHFDHIFTEEELSKIGDEALLIELINNISYKTKKDENEKIKAFDNEKKYLKKRLINFSDKIDYKNLRRLLIKS